IIVVSNHMARRIVDAGVPSANVRVVHNASIVKQQGDIPASSTESAPVIGVIGRLSREKGVDLALRVHSVVVESVKDARLLIVGEGPERAELERYAEMLGIAPSVCWLGYNEDLTELYRRLTVLLIPSRSEGLPN